MIMDYNAPNEILFTQSNLGSYRIMAFNWAKVFDNSPIAGVQEVPPDDSVFQEFMDSMISNM